jgi:uncharacterized protein YdeI (BOF family)
MNKHISLIVGMGFILLAVWMSGCFNEDRSTASIVVISQDPNKYVNTNVTVKGYYVTRAEDLWGWIYTIRDGAGNVLVAELLENVDGSNLVPDTEYYWTGKVVQDKEVIKLIVSDIQPV